MNTETVTQINDTTDTTDTAETVVVVKKEEKEVGMSDLLANLKAVEAATGGLSEDLVGAFLAASSTAARNAEAVTGAIQQLAAETAQAKVASRGAADAADAAGSTAREALAAIEQLQELANMAAHKEAAREGSQVHLLKPSSWIGLVTKVVAEQDEQMNWGLRRVIAPDRCIALAGGAAATGLGVHQAVKAIKAAKGASDVVIGLVEAPEVVNVTADEWADD